MIGFTYDVRFGDPASLREQRRLVVTKEADLELDRVTASAGLLPPHRGSTNLPVLVGPQAVWVWIPHTIGGLWAAVKGV